MYYMKIISWIDYSVELFKNIYTSLYEGLYNKYDGNNPILILGPEYAPLRSMFSGISRRLQNETVRNILISTGGADKLHLTIAIIRFLIEKNVRKIQYIIFF